MVLAIIKPAARLRMVSLHGTVGNGKVDANVLVPSRCLEIESFFKGTNTFMVQMNKNQFYC